MAGIEPATETVNQTPEAEGVIDEDTLVTTAMLFGQLVGDQLLQDQRDQLKESTKEV